MTKDTTELKDLKEIPVEKWQQLGEKKIFFGHQSVGNNIVCGLEKILKENSQIKLNIREAKTLEKFVGPVFMHFKVGENFDPFSKNRDFALMITDGIGNNVDIAFYKYCYVDIKEGADVGGLFTSYKENMSILKKQYSNVTFVHVTVPLVVVQTGPKVWVKKIIGREIGGYDDNIKRNEFNELMRNEYSGKEPVFDLAQIEATYPDGSRMSFSENGKTYNSLVPDYARDGRHLNEKGSKFVAEQLLILLADLKT